MPQPDATTATPGARVRQSWLMRRIRDWRSPATVWLGHWALHAATFIVMLPLMIAGDTIGDLPLYREWASQAISGGSMMGIDEPWVYPLLAWLPIGGAHIVGPVAYLAVWILMTTALNTWALRTLLRSGTRGAVLAGWAWLAAVLALSPVGMLRLEGITAPLVVVALAHLVHRPFFAGVLLAVATWIKVWPAAVIGAAVVLLRSRLTIVVAGASVTAGVALLAVMLGGLDQLTSFLSQQTSRNLQLEAPIATPWVWMAMLDIDDAYVYQNHDIATREVVGPLDGSAMLLSTPLMALTAIVALVVAHRAVRLGHDRFEMLLLASLTIATGLFAWNKVGSPQYMLWLLPIAVVGVAVGGAWWQRMMVALVATGLVTTFIFPIAYMPLVDLQPWAVMLLTVRNVLLIAILAACLARMVSLAGVQVLGEQRPTTRELVRV